MILEIKDINKSFGDNHVLRGINLTASSGRAFGLLGRNGAGKTTTIRILMGIFEADSGSILYEGMPLDYSKVKIGYMPEERGLFPKKDINTQLLYLAKLKGMKKKEAQERIDYWLDRLELMEYKQKKLDTLSKGNQQKIQLITTVVHNPDILILDELFSGLDPVNAQILKDVINDEIAAGKIIFFSSHQMSYVEEFCDKIAILNDGEIAISGSLKEIKKSYIRDKLVVKADDISVILENEQKAEINGDNSVIIHLEASDNKNAVMKYMIDKYDIDSIEVYEPSLNDIFVQYTKKAR